MCRVVNLVRCMRGLFHERVRWFGTSFNETCITCCEYQSARLEVEEMCVWLQPLGIDIDSV